MVILLIFLIICKNIYFQKKRSILRIGILENFGELEIAPLGFEWRMDISIDGSVGSKFGLAVDSQSEYK